MQNEITSIIEEIDGQLVVSHRVIAVQTENSQISIRKLIDKHAEKLERFGALSFEMTVLPAGQGTTREKTYYLNEQQATLLLTFMRNNEIVIEFKVRLVEDFFKMREALKSQKVVSVQEVDPIEKRVQLIEQSERLYFSFKRVFEDIGITKKTELAITTNRAVKNETEIDFIALSGKNGLEVEEKYHTVTELCELIRESDNFSDEIKLSVSTKNNLKPQPINLNKILESHGFQIKIDKQWKPTEKGEKFVKFVQNKSLSSTKNIFHLNWKLEILNKLF
jgi:phage regulator Rha-like protein